MMTRSMALLALALSATAASAAPRRISREALEDKIRGGWAGQMIGVSYGAPTEFRSLGKVLEGPIAWSPDRVSNSIGQDDLYVEMTFAEVMDRRGLDATTEDYGEMFKGSKYALWHANAAARRHLNDGIKAPRSGHPKYNIHANDIDFQIEADFIGLMTPGLPEEANRYCDRVGRVMNYGDGLYGGMFTCGMYSAAFFEGDVRRVVELGLASIPRESGYAKVIRDTLDAASRHPDDWKEAWREIEVKWDRDDPCPDGALEPFNIDARLNGAYIALGLLYGKGDFARTLEISTRSGQDSDCNPASAGGVLGVMLGWSGIPGEWKSGIAGIADTKFQFTSYSFNEIVRSTLDRALKVVEKAGGKAGASEVEVPDQEPKAPPLEQWDMGIPDKVLAAAGGAWRWKGDWKEEKGSRSAAGAGAEAVLRFEGTAVAVVGVLSQSGGRADVFLDGGKAGEINAYIVPNTHDNDLWHAEGLKPGAHELRIVTRDDADPRSKGKAIAISKAIAYRAR